MAFSWKESFETNLSSESWNESVYGAKVTNVLGLAWNYYVVYTKFITGLDMTLDMGMKAEFFFAGTIKIGYADELSSIGNMKTGVTQVMTNISQKCQNIDAARQELVQQLMAMITTHYEMVGELFSSNGTEIRESDSLDSTTTGAENRQAGSFTLSAGSEVGVDAPIIDLLGNLIVNGTFEVLP